MTKITHILVATDMSARSDRAVRRAVQLAQSLNAKLQVLTVLDDAMPSDLTETLVGKARTVLERFVATVPGGERAELIVATGYPAEEVLAHADDGPDLLVMGTHRPRAFFGELRETTAQRIARKTRLPVLLVTDQPDHPYTRALAACDFTPAATAAIELAHDLAPEAEVTPLFALHVPYSGMLAQTGTSAEMLEASFRREIEAEADAWKEHSGLPRADTAKLEIVSGAPIPLLRERCKAGDVDLICVGAHGRVGAARPILGSLTADLMRDPPADLLVARP